MFFVWEVLFERRRTMSFFKSSENKMQIKMVMISFSTDVFLMILNKCGIIFLSVTQIFSNYKFAF